MQTLINELKDAEQDFEFYPTTKEIIDAMLRDMRLHLDDTDIKHHSVLDIGAGNGKVLQELAQAKLFGRSWEDRDKWTGFSELYAIEKSTRLIQELDPKIFVIGTDFEEQSLMGKHVGMIFSNPPYSIFETWAEKIIRESAAPLVYLVIPERWHTSERIKDALRFRMGDSKIVGSFDFLNSEDRTARAKVHLVRVELSDDKDQVFERFFDEQFADLKAKFAKDAEADGETKKATRADQFRSLVPGADYPSAVVELYRRELAKIQKNYEAAAQLDADLLREFEIHPERIMGCLKKRLTDLRMVYWHELFNRMKPITSRLTNASRETLLRTLNEHTHVDFTVGNIHAVLIWAIKNSNRFIDSQMIATYELMVEKCNVFNYVSNQRVFVEGRWRYEEQKDNPNSHYGLDFRIVMQRAGGLGNEASMYGWEARECCGLEKRAFHFLKDLLTVANNLGFPPIDDGEFIHGGDKWKSNESHELYCKISGERRELFEVKAFKNGNLHLRLSKAFALALNVEHGRLKGWIRSKHEAAEELKDPKAADFFKCNHQLLSGPNVLLLS